MQGAWKRSTLVKRHTPCADNPYAVHGGLDVQLSLHKDTVVNTLPNTGARPVLRLQPIDATNMDAETLMDLLYKRLDAGMPPNAIILLDVNDCSATCYEQLNFETIEHLRSLVRRCDIRFHVRYPSTEQSQEALSEASLDYQWQSFLARTLSDDEEHEWYLEQGAKRIEVARQELLAAHAQVGDEG
jgi:hypothetical protein